MAKVGFIGLGIMGAPMAVNLQKGGHQLFVHSHKAPSAELTDLGAIPCASNQEVARQADIIILMLPDTPQVQEVLFDENGVRSEEHTSELQSLMRISYAVFCLKKTTKTDHDTKK